MRCLKIGCIITLLLCGFFANVYAKATLSWKYDGTIRSGKTAKKLELQNIHDGILLKDGVIVIGYKIDKDGINIPTAAWVRNDLQTVKYWTYQNDLKQVFRYGNDVFLVDSNGDALKFVNEDWQKSDIKLKPKSIAIPLGNDIIGCFPSALLMTSPEIGECYSIKNGWKRTLNWIAVKPAMCNGNLAVLEKRDEQHLLQTIDVHSGSVIHSKLVKPNTALCNRKSN